MGPAKKLRGPLKKKLNYKMGHNQGGKNKARELFY